jgi:AhpD family alkylhydroperoxidase
MSFTPRLNFYKASPEAIKAMMGMESAIKASGLEHSLLELIKMRCSQINGCAYCMDMHSRDARAAGETERRLHQLIGWRESPLFTERERAAMQWAESLTQIATARMPDEIYAQVSAQFTETELVNLTLAVVTINAWNRFAISFNLTPPAELS